MAAQLIQVLNIVRPSVKCIVAPYEADAQLAYLSTSGIIDVVVSEDSDNIPYGSKEIIFKLEHCGNCEYLNLQDIFMKQTPGFDLRCFSQEMVLIMCIASGCD